MLLTFLEAKRPLTKIFSDSGTTPYPLVKNVTSHEVKVTNTAEMHTAIVEHGNLNHGLLKGPLTKSLTNESRAGHADKIAPSQLFVLDIDGIESDVIGELPLVINEAALRRVSDKIIAQLPPAFHDVSYVVQASASLGMKGNLVSLHYFFMLQSAVPPAYQKDILQILNFDDGFFDAMLTLTGVGRSLHYPVDTCMAQNSRIIYIAPPVFTEGQVDPVKVRTLHTECEYDKLDLTTILKSMSPAQIENATKTKIKSLRRAANLPIAAGSFKVISSEGSSWDLCLNPDKARMELSHINGNFAYFNINGGDSLAYYVNIHNPLLVYNFKQEPIFKFQDVDRTMYNDFMETHAVLEEKLDTIEPVVFRDLITGVHFNGIYDAESLRVLRMHKAAKGDLAEFMVQHNTAMPEPIPSWDYTFKPETFEGVNVSEGWVNKFMPTKYMTDNSAPAIMETIGYENGQSLKDHAPLSYLCLAHSFNYADDEIKHFINWLAFVVQKRQKTQTAWVIAGTPGTGKGSLMHGIMAPILGDHFYFCQGRNVKDQFNSWILQTLLCVIDEFRMDDLKGDGNEVISWLKSSITDPKGVARTMRVDPTSELNYLNFIILSNQYDVIRIEPNDRRFNVAPRQEESLASAHPNIRQNFSKQMASEVMPFARFLLDYAVDDEAAITVIDNKAKRTMQSTTETSIEEFANALRKSDLGYFVTNVLQVESSDPIDATVLAAGRAIIRSWIENTKREVRGVHITDIMVMYQAVFGKKITQTKLAHMLAYKGIDRPDRVLINGQRKSGWDIKWNLTKWNVEQLLKDYYSTPEGDFLGKKINMGVKHGV